MRQWEVTLYGRKGRLANQPREGPQLTAQNQIMQTILKTLQLERKIQCMHGLRWTLKLERQTPKNLPREEIPYGCSC